MKELKVIAFDADDTLWDNEIYFEEVEQHFCAMLEDFVPKHSSAKVLFQVEMENLATYGYGIKAFMLSMIEAAIRISDGRISAASIQKVIALGKDMLQKPVVLLPQVEETLKVLGPEYKIVVATKGDLLDQERKLRKSGLMDYFHHVEIMTDKRKEDYAKLLHRLEIHPEEFMMVGNSLKSDVLPVLDLGGTAVHIPYKTTWAHERIDHSIEHPNFYQATHIEHIPTLISAIWK